MMKLIEDYKTKFSYEQRVEQSSKILRKYESRIPIMVFSKDVILNRFKYLVPQDLTFSQFQYVVRQRLEKLDESQALYFFCNNQLISPNSTMSQLYDNFKDEDGHLYINICKENTFGNKFN